MKPSPFLATIGLVCAGGLLVSMVLLREPRSAARSMAWNERPHSETSTVLERSEHAVRADKSLDQARVAATADPVPANSTLPVADARDLPEGTLSEMKTKVERLRSVLEERDLPLLNQRFDDGFGVKISDEPKYSGLPEDERDIYSIVMVPGQGTFRVVLPASDYPELYQLKRDRQRLEARIRELEYAEIRRQYEKAHPK